LAGLYSEGCTSVAEPEPSRDHTERMLRGFGYPVLSAKGVISLQGGGSLKACDIDVPADISSAAFFLVAASIAPDSDLILTHVGINPTRIGVINILQLMGANITLQNHSEVGGEPVADIRVRSAALRGIEIPLDQVPLAIDEFPVLFVAAACATGRTVLRGAEELRVKESDRIAAMAEGLTTLGIINEVLEDGIIIEGGTFGGGVIKTYHDHRIAMSFAIAALRAKDEITVLDCDHVATSFPGFDSLARSLGLQIQAEAS
jgi:3-phosphoshikimate 1-carboxyvinyltransferase